MWYKMSGHPDEYHRQLVHDHKSINNIIFNLKSDNTCTVYTILRNVSNYKIAGQTGYPSAVFILDYS